MLSASQIAVLLNQVYLKKKNSNKLDFWRTYIDSKNVKDGL